MRYAPFLLAACALSLAACGDDAPSALVANWPSAEERTVEEGHAPTPYTAEQIRAACPTGLRIVYLMDILKEGRNKHIFAFDECDEKGTRFTLVQTTEEGQVSDMGRSERRSWADLQRHASTPKAQTTVATETITVPGGTFPCMRYTVKRLDPERGEIADTLWFAYELPGPPIRWTKSIAGEQILEMTLLERKGAEEGK